MDPATLQTLANAAEILGAGTIVTALVFGLGQIRLLRAQRENAVASQLSQTFMDEGLARAVLLLQQLPDEVSAEELRARGREYEEAAIIATMSFETIGLLVYRGIAERDLALDLAGGIMGVCWRKLVRYQLTLREELGQPSWAEWFEWLAVQSYERKGTDAPRV